MLGVTLATVAGACTLVRDWSDLEGPDRGSSVCGNGVIDPGEQCDDGNNPDGGECTSDCKVICNCPDANCFTIPNATSCYRLGGLPADAGADATGADQATSSQACQGWCGDELRCGLATIGDQVEMRNLSIKLNSEMAPDFVWIAGGNPDGGKYRWPDGAPVEGLWAPGEPTQMNEHCLMLWRYPNGMNEYAIADDPCYRRHAYLCERKPVGSPP